MKAVCTYVVLVGGLLLGCSSGPVDLAPHPPMNPALLGMAEGSGCGFLLLNSFPLGVNTRAQRAHAEARAALGSDDVADVKVRERWAIVPLLGTVLCTDVVATAVR